MDPLSDDKVLDSWHKNAEPWASAIRDSRIESRNLVTNQAIIDAILARHPESVLDIGCGEGWLVRALAEHAIKGIGVDAVPDLIARAKTEGGGDFRVMSYESIASGDLSATADVVAINFALIGKESVEALFKRLPELITAGGAVIIQTLHPLMSCGDAPYVDGWREGSWAGFSADFTDPAPWYFRTMESWVRLFSDSGMSLIDLREPLHPSTGKPASVIFTAVRS
ncbi:MAG TPA: class I SAM-dependent methyltransferase [Gemmatimonadaceae bacterium]|nr:class I SAM-dependent methyltransferase [Gemmatimonadaceae bacterium]